ncbi:MAG TPA: hypothetical protein VMW93_02330 [bacterium]|nr:hypothetical protein [bacterium]
MKRIYFIGAVASAFVIGFFVGCGDEMLNGADGAQRYVYEVSEANVTGNGDVIDVPILKVGREGGGGRDMATVAVYGSGYGSNNTWRMLTFVELSEGQVKVNHDEYRSHYYRVVVVY